MPPKLVTRHSYFAFHVSLPFPSGCRSTLSAPLYEPRGLVVLFQTFLGLPASQAFGLLDSRDVDLFKATGGMTEEAVPELRQRSCGVRPPLRRTCPVRPRRGLWLCSLLCWPLSLSLPLLPEALMASPLQVTSLTETRGWKHAAFPWLGLLTVLLHLRVWNRPLFFPPNHPLPESSLYDKFNLHSSKVRPKTAVPSDSLCPGTIQPICKSPQCDLQKVWNLTRAFPHFLLHLPV